MKLALAIGRKEFLGIVKTPMFFSLMSVCSLMWSYNFIRSLLLFAGRSMNNMTEAVSGYEYNIHYAVFAGHLDFVNFILVVLIPALTMKLVAEEKKKETLGLLLTSPVTSAEITVGKFIGGYFSGLVVLLISLMFPGLALFLGDFPIGPLASSYIGLLLVTGLYTAVGLFFSSLTESPIVAVILGVCANIVFWNLGKELQQMSSEWMVKVFEQISLGVHFTHFLKGGVALSSIVYLLSLTALFVYFAERVIESSRWR